MYVVIIDYQTNQIHYNEWSDDDEFLYRDAMDNYFLDMNLSPSDCYYMFTNEHMIMSNITTNPKLIVSYENQETIAIPIYTPMD